MIAQERLQKEVSRHVKLLDGALKRSDSSEVQRLSSQLFNLARALVSAGGALRDDFWQELQRRVDQFKAQMTANIKNASEELKRKKQENVLMSSYLGMVSGSRGKNFLGRA